MERAHINSHAVNTFYSVAAEVLAGKGTLHAALNELFLELGSNLMVVYASSRYCAQGDCSFNFVYEKKIDAFCDELG